jgi:hypothetical protein
VHQSRTGLPLLDEVWKVLKPRDFDDTYKGAIAKISEVQSVRQQIDLTAAEQQFFPVKKLQSREALKSVSSYRHIVLSLSPCASTISRPFLPLPCHSYSIFCVSAGVLTQGEPRSASALSFHCRCPVSFTTRALPQDDARRWPALHRSVVGRRRDLEVVDAGGCRRRTPFSDRPQPAPKRGGVFSG